MRDFLGLPGSEQKPGWKGKLVTDDFSGYKACFELGVTEVGCMAHARRKFHELWVDHESPVGEQALKFFGALYDVERRSTDLIAEITCASTCRRSVAKPKPLRSAKVRRNAFAPDDRSCSDPRITG